MGPRGLGAKTIKFLKLFKSLKIRKTIVLLTIGKAPHRNSAAGALKESSRSLIWSCWGQKVFLEFFEEVRNLSKLTQNVPRSQNTFFGHLKIQKQKNHENQCFFDNWKNCASKSCGGSTEREPQIIDMVILGAKRVFGNL